MLWGTTPGTSLNVQLVGQNQLFGRGMNAAATIFDHFLYVGSRTASGAICWTSAVCVGIRGSYRRCLPWWAFGL
jgi:hypothetical protein